MTAAMMKMVITKIIMLMIMMMVMTMIINDRDDDFVDDVFCLKPELPLSYYNNNNKNTLKYMHKKVNKYSMYKAKPRKLVILYSPIDMDTV